MSPDIATNLLGDKITLTENHCTRKRVAEDLAKFPRAVENVTSQIDTSDYKRELVRDL